MLAILSRSSKNGLPTKNRDNTNPGTDCVLNCIDSSVLARCRGAKALIMIDTMVEDSDYSSDDTVSRG